MHAESVRRAVDGILAGDFSDPTNERIIYLSAAGLVVVGLALLVGTLVWWRRGRQEHPSLAPLEVMGARSWVKAPDADRRRRLEQVRLSGAAGSVEEPVRSAPVDLEALVRSVPQAFDDLREPSSVISPAVAEEPVAEEPVPDGPVADDADADADAEAEPESEAVDDERVADEPDAVADEDVEPVDATMIEAERPIEHVTKSPVAPEVS
ncbi:MAG TPA: hypothetical protein VGC84_05080 [Ilumatobacteraceae bacterium]